MSRPSDELRALARVLIPALYMVAQFQQANRAQYPDQHPYRLATLMVLRYLERRYSARADPACPADAIVAEALP